MNDYGVPPPPARTPPPFYRFLFPQSCLYAGSSRSCRDPSHPNHVLRGGKTAEKRAFARARGGKEDYSEDPQHCQLVGGNGAGEEQGGLRAPVSGKYIDYINS